MSDLGTDQLSAAFAAFTDHASREVVMPSSAAIRRTVMHRRAAASGACGAFALAAIGGSVYWASHIDGGPGHNPGVPAEPARTYPVATPLPTTAHQLISSWGNLQDNNDGTPGTQSDHDESRHAAGNYYLTFVCRGGGSVSLSYLINGSGPTLQYACDGTAHTSGQSVARAVSGMVVTIVPDAAAGAAHVAYAYRIDFGAAG
jgi:hypothetical protein